MLANPVVGIVECPLFDYLVPNHWHRVEKRDRLGGTSGHLRFSGRCLLIIASGCWSKALLVPLNPKKNIGLLKIVLVQEVVSSICLTFSMST